MRYFRYFFLIVFIMGCGLPVTVGSIGQKKIEPTVPVNTIQSDFAEAVFVVTADVLTVRVCPAQECQVAYRDGAEFYFYKGDPVMGACYRFVDEIWLGFDFVDGEPTKFAAVLFDGVYLMEGSCNG